MTQSNLPLYDRIGGELTIDALIDEFYNRVLSDDMLAPFFAQTSIDKLRAMQKEFFTAALDGPIEYTGADLVAVHHGRGITRQHMTRFVNHFMDCLHRFNLSQHDIDEVLNRITMHAGKVIGDANVDG